MILLFAPHDGADHVTEASRWVAEQAAAALAAAGGGPAMLLSAETCDRAQLEAALRASEVVGFGAWCHGSNETLWNHRHQPVLDWENAAVLARRWAYFFACLAGNGLAEIAVARGASRAVGYTATLKVDWRPKNLPEALRPSVTDVFTTTFLALASHHGGDLAQNAADAETRFLRAAKRLKGSLAYRQSSGAERARQEKVIDRLAITARQMVRCLVVQSSHAA